MKFKNVKCVLAKNRAGQALKLLFPGVKFQVEIDGPFKAPYVYVSWLDGPSKEDVEAVTDKVRGEFDFYLFRKSRNSPPWSF